jgi:hypothetical protein
LSPQEISQPGDAQANHGRGKSATAQNQALTLPSNCPTGDGLDLTEAASAATVGMPHLLPPRSEEGLPDTQTDLETSKKQAKDAILRLWPLNIRFQNYLAEGVEEELLKTLFEDLGLNFAEMALKTSRVKKSMPSEETSDNPKAMASENKSLPKPTATPVDPSEERKDRIARLLAAKGSKQNPASTLAPAAPVAPNTAQEVSKSTKSALTQSEKSRLLQQKMQALNQARKALKQQKSIHLDDKNNSSWGNSTPEGIRTTSRDESSASGTDTFAGAIPGLSRPPNNPSTEPAYARSAPAFDQNTKSKPFLIDVSEDEDGGDAEMDIDSPGRPETPPNTLSSPGQQYGLLQDVSGQSDFAIARQVRSPASVSTPLRSTSRNNGSDLEMMNKQIQEMRRKIAEAEARKKAKSSRQGSPALSQPNDSSLEDNSDATGRPVVSPARFYGALGHGVKPALGQSDERRSRSRAASERLPLIEARRREQLLKLKALQFEVVRIEKEIEDDILEEERLKGDILSSDSDQEVEESIHARLAGVAGMLLTRCTQRYY